MPILFQCEMCNTQFTAPPSRAKSYPYMSRKHHFCSNQCRLKRLAQFSKERQNSIEKQCEICNKTILVHLSSIRVGWGRFCSRKCSGVAHSKYMLVNHPNKGKPLSDKQKAALSSANLGRRHSPEVNKSKGRPGTANPFFGHKHSETTKKILSEKGKKRLSDPILKSRNVKLALLGNRQRPTKPEIVLSKILEERFPGQWEYTGNGSLVIGGLCPDFSSTSEKALIELFGRYWHTLGPGASRWTYTEEGRIKTFGLFGFKCLIIWDDELQDVEALTRKILSWR